MVKLSGTNFGVVFVLVDWIFCLSWSRWPFEVALLGGRYLLTTCGVRPGNASKKPLCLPFAKAG